jgi:hypothetical protein
VNRLGAFDTNFLKLTPGQQSESRRVEDEAEAELQPERSPAPRPDGGGQFSGLGFAVKADIKDTRAEPVEPSCL